MFDACVLAALFTLRRHHAVAQQIHTRTMSCERDIRFELLARLCPNSTGADIRSVCTEAGMYAIRARRKTVTEKDFLDAVNKVIKGYQKFSATPKYMVYN
jgi:26S proteasome regulatory subunit T1